MGLKETLQAVGKTLSGGMAGAAATQLDPAARRAKIDAATSDTPAPEASEPASKMVDPKTGIRFKAGGSVDRSIKPGKAQSKPPAAFPKVGNTVPSNGGYKAGGMVRRGYGKARGA